MSISPLHGGLVFPDDVQSNKGQIQSSAEEKKKNLELNARNINEFFNPQQSNLSFEEKLRLCTSVGEEIIEEEDLANLLKRKP